MAGDLLAEWNSFKIGPHSKWILSLLAVLSNNDMDEIILGIKSVQREPVATGLLPDSTWYSEDKS